MNLSFEWLVAWRYLRDRDKPNRWVLAAGGLVLLFAMCSWAVYFVLPAPKDSASLQMGGFHLTHLMLYVSLVLTAFGITFSVFGQRISALSRLASKLRLALARTRRSC